MICQRCQKEKDEIEFPKRKKEFCKACRNAIAVEKYKGTEKGLSSEERFKRTENYKQIHRKSNKKRSEAGYYRELYRNNDEFRKKENQRRMKHHRDHPEIKKEREKRKKSERRQSASTPFSKRIFFRAVHATQHTHHALALVAPHYPHARYLDVHISH